MNALLRSAHALLALGAACLSATRADADKRDAGTCAAYASEAAQRSRLPTEIILRVMMTESRGNARATSSKGAMGCMQIMPATWSYMSSRYVLGSDSYDPRMNMIGGALYLAELAGRYGFPGAYSAYNAGPGRYERYAAGRASLPSETVAYTVRLAGTTPSPVETSAPLRWQNSVLFLIRGAPTVDRPAAAATGSDAARAWANSLFPLAGNNQPPEG